MNRIHIACATALVVASHAVAQLPVPPSNFPRVHSMADNFSPTTVALYHMKLASPSQLMPATATMPTTANFVHCVYSDTDKFVPQWEYKYSTSGGHSWSAPIVFHKFVANEVVRNQAYVDQLVCEKRNVFYLFWSNRADVNASPVSYAIYAYGSNDMGKTWQGPLLMSPFLVGSAKKWNAPTPELDAAAAGGKVHVTYEAHRISNVNGPVPGNEECFYSNAGFDTSGKFVLLRSDVDMSNLGNPNIVDVDAPRIDADGQLVAVIFVHDKVTGTTTGNQTFVRVSQDGGVTFANQVDVSQLGASGIATSGDAAFVAVDASTTGKGSIYCTYQDMRNNVGVTDNLFLMFSKDGGATWRWKDSKSNRIRLNANVGDDVDHVQIVASGGAVAISWFEEPIPPGGNLVNQLRVTVDGLGGLGWTVGIVPPIIDLSKNYGVTNVRHLESMKMKGNFICIGHEVNSPEAAAMSWSCDRGKTWETRIANDGTKDVDEPTCNVTLNGDFNLIYLEDRAGGQKNTTVVTGLKVPTLVNDKSANQGVKVTCANGSIGGLAIALFTATPADMKANKPITFNNTGFAVQITQDIVFSIGLNAAFTQPTVYILTVDAKGNAAFPGILNFSSLVGVPIYCAVATVKLNGTLLEFTDPVKLR